MRIYSQQGFGSTWCMSLYAYLHRNKPATLWCLYSAVPVKTIFLLLFSVRYSFSPSSIAGWFLASVPSGLEAKTVGTTNWSWHTREGGLRCSEFSRLRLAFMPWSSLVFVPAAFLEGRCCAHSSFLTDRRKMSYLKEKVWLPYGTAIALLPNLEIYIR